MTIIYENDRPNPPSIDRAQEKAGRLLGLARAGIAASDTVLNIDLHKAGYRELFEVMATLANDLCGDIDEMEDAERVKG